VEEYNLEISQLSNEENGILTSNFKEEGVFEAISQMKLNRRRDRKGSRWNFIKHFGMSLSKT
jgi:hypothetical protein